MSTVDRHGLAGYVRDVADFPEPGVLFKDITPLLADPGALRLAVDALAEGFAGEGITKVVGIEARGFILATPVALALGAGFVPVRKAGKLPWAVVREEYSLEYGNDKLEMHRDAIRPGEQVLVIDDVLATGGTAAATCRLVEELGGVIVGLGFLLEIGGLNGRGRLGEHRVESLARY